MPAVPRTKPHAISPVNPAAGGTVDAGVANAGAVDPAAVDPAALAEAAEQASEFLKSLANPVRLRILCLLAQGESPVGDIAEKLAARQSLISQHLALLRKDGLVRPRRDGQTIYYTLADERARKLIGVLYESFCPAKPA
jgi:ArsR family transcriptional regulator, virulence genes transcriptional regulator